MLAALLAYAFSNFRLQCDRHNAKRCHRFRLVQQHTKRVISWSSGHPCRFISILFIPAFDKFIKKEENVEISCDVLDIIVLSTLLNVFVHITFNIVEMLISRDRMFSYSNNGKCKGLEHVDI